MLCYYCLPHFGHRGNYPHDPQDGGMPYVDKHGIGHVPCCGRLKCEQEADYATARQRKARRQKPVLRLKPSRP